jgi:hypothetical protein
MSFDSCKELALHSREQNAQKENVHAKARTKLKDRGGIQNSSWLEACEP